jgi:methylenetetrahydrofolate reductase (NADPH)
LITHPIFDLERFHVWWKAVTERGIHEKAAILAGIQVLPEAEVAKASEGKRSLSRIPQSTLERVGSAATLAGRRSAAIEIALETIRQLSMASGLRGFSFCTDGDEDAALEILGRSGLGSS